VSFRPDRWCLSVWRPDGMTRRLDGWNSRQMGVRTGWHIVRTVDRELWNSSDFTLKSGIPVCRIITHKWFCPNTKYGQNTNKLPLWPFWDKNHLTGLEIHSQSKIKSTPPFCHKGVLEGPRKQSNISSTVYKKTKTEKMLTKPSLREREISKVRAFTWKVAHTHISIWKTSHKAS